MPTPPGGPTHPARNLELKVRCDAGGLNDVRARLLATGAALAEMTQRDTYFAVGRGRLKLREIIPASGPAAAELIAYARPDESGPRWSAYTLVPIPPTEAPALLTALTATIGTRVVVEKTRQVAILGRTRVHLDRVTGLGDFVELETVVTGPDDMGAATELAAVASTLGLDRYEAIAGSYSDLLLAVPGGLRQPSRLS